MALRHLIRLRLCKDAQISAQWVGDVLLQIIPERWRLINVVHVIILQLYIRRLWFYEHIWRTLASIWQLNNGNNYGLCWFESDLLFLNIKFCWQCSCNAWLVFRQLRLERFHSKQLWSVYIESGLLNAGLIYNETLPFYLFRSQWSEPARRCIRQRQTAARLHKTENSWTRSQRRTTVRHIQDSAGDNNAWFSIQEHTLLFLSVMKNFHCFTFVSIVLTHVFYQL